MDSQAAAFSYNMLLESEAHYHYVLWKIMDSKIQQFL